VHDGDAWGVHGGDAWDVHGGDAWGVHGNDAVVSLPAFTALLAWRAVRICSVSDLINRYVKYNVPSSLGVDAPTPSRSPSRCHWAV
jgi:hypothetical protein